MSCFNPNLMECRVDSNSGALAWIFKGPGRYDDPRTFGSWSSLAETGRFKVAIPCRHCIGCHLDYARDWANRLLIELKDMKCGIFLTLTYDNEHLPRTRDGVPTLSKRDIQLFFKRLRKHFADRKIRYYICGEYGPKTLRPHYHAILFGLDLNELKDTRVVQKNEVGDLLYSSPTLVSIWSNGMIGIGEVNFKTCSYVGRYCLKKHYKQNKAELHGALPEFTLSSRNPGIGMLHYDDYLLSDSDYVTVVASDGSRTFPMPKCFIKKGRKDENLVDLCINLAYTKFEQSNAKLCSDLNWTNDPFDVYLRKKYQDQLSRFKLLPERGECK